MFTLHNSVWLTLISGVLEVEGMGKYCDVRLGLCFYFVESLYLLVDESDP